MKNNIYFLIRSFLISLLFFLLLPLHSFACPNNCSGNGACGRFDGVCLCYHGWSSSDCSVPCPNECSGKGFCGAASVGCDCYSGWSGLDCTIPCMDCSGHGSCESDSGSGTCRCNYGWSGSDCSISTSSTPTSTPTSTPIPTPTPITFTNTSCPNDCSGHGVCNSDGNCSCDNDWLGSDCSVSTSSTPTPTPTLTTFCPNDCSGNGACSEDSCLCNFAWSGSDCSDFTFTSDKETRQAIKDNIQNVNNQDNQALQKIKEGDYSSVLSIIDKVVESLINIKDTVGYIDNLNASVEFKIDRLLQSSIKNHEKASSTIDRIVNDPKVQEDGGLLSRLLKQAKNYLLTGRRHAHTTSIAVAGVRG